MKIKRGFLLIVVVLFHFVITTTVNALLRHRDIRGKREGEEEEEEIEIEAESEIKKWGDYKKRKLRTSAAEKLRRKGRLKFRDRGVETKIADASNSREVDGISQGAGGLDASLTGFTPKGTEASSSSASSIEL